MSKVHPHGKALNILQFNGDQIVLNKNELESLLLHSEIKDRKIMILTIVGAFRKGKSFFMDYCLRFMYANVGSQDI